VRQIRRCSHSLPLLRHSSQPSALGFTSAGRDILGDDHIELTSVGVDGEVFTMATPLVITIVPRSLLVKVPKGDYGLGIRD